MPYLEISKAQFKKLLNDYINEELSSEEFHNIIMKFLKQYKHWDNVWFDDMKLFIDKEIHKSTEEDLWW